MTNLQLYLYSGCIFFILGLTMIITYFTTDGFPSQTLTVSIILLIVGLLLFILFYISANIVLRVEDQNRPILE
jgi:hypothetical protein